MQILWIILTILAVLLLLVLLLLLYGKATLRIICRERLRLVLRIGPIPITLVSDKEKKPPSLKRCHHPERTLRKELRLHKKRLIKAAKKNQRKAKKAEKKATKRALAAKQQKPHPFDYLKLVKALLRELSRRTSGRIDFKIRRLHIYVASDDASKTALLYAGCVNALNLLLRWIESRFNHIERDAGAADVFADFGTIKPHADIDLSATMHLSSAISVALGMLKAYRREQRLLKKRVAARAAKKQAKSNKRAASF